MKLIRSFAFAWKGIKICFVSENNFRIHALLAVAAVTLGIGFNISSGEWLIILFCIAFVMTMEMINTAVERLCDIVNKEIDPCIKIIKDIAAGAVLVSAVFSLIAGCMIFLPKITVYLKSL